MNRDRWVLLANPTAGHGKGRKRAVAAASLFQAKGLPFDLLFSGKPGEAIEQAKNAVETGCRAVIALGGDGTMNEVAEGYLRVGAGKRGETPIGGIGTGSGNDFLRDIGFPTDLEAAVNRLTTGTTRPLDAVQVSYQEGGKTITRHSLSVSGIGFPATATDLANKFFKGLGSLCYLAGGVLALIQGPNQEFSLLVDGEPLNRHLSMLVLCNTGYFGSGIEIHPEADPGDGFLDLLTADACPRVSFVGMYAALLKKRHLNHRLIHIRKIREIRIEQPIGMPILVDGEVLGTTPVDIHILPGVLKFLG